MQDYLYPPPPTLPPGSEVITYMRDSGGPNQQESIGQQERVIQDYCKKYGLVLIRVYAETASGRKTKNRDQFLEMCEFIRTCPKDLQPRGLILWAFSRFSRDVVDFNYYLFGLIKSGIVIHSITEQIPEGIAGQMLLQVKAFTNADYSIQLGKQIKRAIHSRVEEGYNNGGTPPKGYIIQRIETPNLRRKNGAPRIGIKWQPDPILAPLVRQAWELRAQGKSYAEITKATQGKLYTAKNSWLTHFQNESYLGIGKAGDLRVENHHEPLITWDLWQAVREAETIRRRRYHPQRMKHPYLLSGLSFCLFCGASMVVHTSDGYRSYICGTRDRKKGFSNCSASKRVNAPKAERLILDTVLNRILSAEFASEMLEDVQKHLADTDKIDREIGQVNNALIDIELSITRLIDLAESAGNIEEISKRLIDLKRRKVEHISRIRALKAEQERKTPIVTLEALTMIFDTWRDQIRNATERGEIIIARKLLYQFVSKIELGYNKAVIHYTYPTSAIPANEAVFGCAHRHHLF